MKRMLAMTTVLAIFAASATASAGGPRLAVKAHLDARSYHNGDRPQIDLEIRNRTSWEMSIPNPQDSDGSLVIRVRTPAGQEISYSPSWSDSIPLDDPDLGPWQRRSYGLSVFPYLSTDVSRTPPPKLVPGRYTVRVEFRWGQKGETWRSPALAFTVR
jgi:hypothetical protein